MTTQRTAAQVAADLTAPRRAALLACIAQDPHGERTKLSGGRSRALPVTCDKRCRGSLVLAGCLGWAAGWDDLNTVTPFGREVAALLESNS